MRISTLIIPLGLTALLLTGCGKEHKKAPKVNTVPQATAASFSTQADTVYTGTLKGTDAENDKLSFALVAMPTNGTVALKSDGSFTYTPNADTTGTDKFTFTASDGVNVSTAAEVKITLDLLQVSFGDYSRLVFKQDATANPLPLDSRSITQDVTAADAYDDLLMP